MKKIYLILTSTGTVLSRLIRLTTKDEFSHVSIALDKDLLQMYSFGRLNAYNPFYGGFVHEGITVGTFKRFEDTTLTKIYSLEINDYQYNKLKRQLKAVIKCKEKYRFNMIGLILARFRFKIKRVDCYYCAEFIKKLMDDSQIKTNLPEVAKPEDFKYLNNIEFLYSGMLKDYKTIQS